MALLQCQPEAGLLHHSDQGRQYTSETYQSRFTTAHCQVSMSRVGNCYDNAAMESIIGPLKSECATQPFAMPNTEVVAKAKRKRFTAAEKLRILREVDVQWKLFALVHNIGKIHHYGLAL
jgi:transposase InsO family protein